MQQGRVGNGKECLKWKCVCARTGQCVIKGFTRGGQKGQVAFHLQSGARLRTRPPFTKSTTKAARDLKDVQYCMRPVALSVNLCCPLHDYFTALSQIFLWHPPFYFSSRLECRCNPPYAVLNQASQAVQLERNAAAQRFFLPENTQAGANVPRASLLCFRIDFKILAFAHE